MVCHLEECFFGIIPMGYTYRFKKGALWKGPAVWPRVTIGPRVSIIVFVVHGENGLIFAQGKLEYSLGAL